MAHPRVVRRVCAMNSGRGIGRVSSCAGTYGKRLGFRPSGRAVWEWPVARSYSEIARQLAPGAGGAEYSPPDVDTADRLL
jgi:hypothetical protein